MEMAWGVELPEVDLQAVRAEDRWRADGLPIDDCTP
ncbi:MAG: hypothetical protein ACJATT_004939 [Myxococcota bacterium]|jgi:hypothetical protein